MKIEWTRIHFFKRCFRCRRLPWILRSQIGSWSDHRSYSISFNFSNFVKFFWNLWILKEPYLRPMPNVELFMKRTTLQFGSTSIKLRSSGGSDVEPINWFRPKSNFCRTRLNIHSHANFVFTSLVRRIWRSTFVPETIFRRSIRLKQTDRTC